MPETRRIAVLLDRNPSFFREMLQGIRSYAASRPSWVLRDGPPRLPIVSHLRQWRPHGIIAGLMLRSVARQVIRLGKPLVDTASVLSGLSVPTVDVNHTALGRLAAEYLLDRKFSHFGFFGSESAVYSQIEESAFRQRLAEAGRELSSCYSESLPDLANAALWRKSPRKTQRWLRRLPKPAAVLCCEDALARRLADTCAEIGLRVPDDVALLGAGNDQLECNLTRPALSSVAVPSQRIGYEAASLLDRLMAGGDWPSEPVLLPPLHVVGRFSTDIVAVDDEIVRAALQFVGRRACEDISVAGVAAKLAVGRRLLERRFRDLLGRSVLEEIHRVRVERVKNLLTATDLPIEIVATKSGFSSARRLDVVFASLTSMSPTAYRRQSRTRHEPE